MFKLRFYIPSTSVVTRLTRIAIGKDFGISPECKILAQDSASHISIGDHVKLNYNVMINADRGGEIYIGNRVIIGPNVVIRASDHESADYDTPIQLQGHIAGKIHIKDNVWIGANVTILKNVSLGEGAIIGAGAVVTKDVPPFVVSVGNPARVIRDRKTVDRSQL
ncbi:MAG: galactoside O-acetyltransferase [Lentimonas sp.]|jgi:galactoside O-acetyltransferase